MVKNGMSMRRITGGLCALALVGTLAGCALEEVPTASADKPKADSDKPAAKPSKPKAEAEEKPADVAVFKVWGEAPSGMEITYGSDSESLDGKGLPFEKTLKVKDDAMYYTLNAQLGGSGDIRCSVTIGKLKKEGRARGNYNICNVQLNSNFSGGWTN